MPQEETTAPKAKKGFNLKFKMPKFDKLKFPKFNSKKKDGTKSHVARNIILGIVGFVAFVLIVLGTLVYGVKDESAFTRTIVKVVPFPAGYTDGRIITMNSYFERLQIIKNYYINYKKTDFTTDDGKKQLSELRAEVMNNVTEDQIVAAEAKKNDVKITNDEIESSFNELIKSNGGVKDFSEILSKFYGLSVDEFKVIIYKPRALREKLAEKINSNESVTGEAKKQADEIYAKAKAGEDFAKLAKEYSQDTGSAANGGDLGYFSKGKMVPAFEEAAFALKKGEISEPIRTVYGYHIIKVTDIKDGQVKASHILIKVQDFNGWLEDLKTKLKDEKKTFILYNTDKVK